MYADEDKNTSFNVVFQREPEVKVQKMSVPSTLAIDLEGFQIQSVPTEISGSVDDEV